MKEIFLVGRILFYRQYDLIGGASRKEIYIHWNVSLDAPEILGG
jgi:hypothetical protein